MTVTNLMTMTSTNRGVTSRNQVLVCVPTGTPILRLDESIAVHMLSDARCIWYLIGATYRDSLLLESFEYWDYGK